MAWPGSVRSNFIFEGGVTGVSQQPAHPVERAPYPADWSPFARRVAGIGLILALLFTASLVGPVIHNAILALILAFLLVHPIQILTKRTRLSYRWAAVLVFLLYLILAVLVLTLVVGPVVQFLIVTAAGLGGLLNQSIQFLRSYTPDQGWLIDPQTGQRLFNFNFMLEPLSRWARGERLEELAQVVPGLVDAVTVTAGTVGSLATNALLIHILAIVFLLEIPRGFVWLFESIPPPHRREYAILFERMSKMWANYFQANLTIGLIMGILVWLMMTVLGIRNAVIVGFIAGVFALLPVVGTFVAFPVLGLNTFFAGSTYLDISPLALTLIVLTIYALIGLTLFNIVYPAVAGEAVALPISVIILGIIIGGALFGVLGIFLAPAVLAVIRYLVEFVIKKIRGGDPYPGEPTPLFLAQIGLDRAEPGGGPN
jgi:predicted PurR-regulated permease PerM